MIGDALVELPMWPSNINARSGALVHAALTTNSIGYFIGLDNGMLVVQHLNGNATNTLASFDAAHQLACGVATNGWNMLRFKISGGRIQVWFNVMFTDVVKNGGKDVVPLEPRIDVFVPKPALPPGNFVLQSDRASTRFDYIGVFRDTLDVDMRSRWADQKMI